MIVIVIVFVIVEDREIGGVYSWILGLIDLWIRICIRIPRHRTLQPSELQRLGTKLCCNHIPEPQVVRLLSTALNQPT